MYPTTSSVTVWFACKTCRGSFKKLHDFLEHKIQDHFQEFENTKCIIFEEREISSSKPQIVTLSPTCHEIEDIHPHKYSDPLIKKVENEPNGSNLEFPNHSSQTVGFVKTEHQSIGYDFENDHLDDFISFKNEAGTNSDSIVQHQHQHNPCVLLKRLTCQEIQNLSTKKACSAHSNNNNNLLQCKLCRENFNSAALKAHINVCVQTHPEHHNSGFCVQCNKIFSSKRHLFIHSLRRHAPEEEKAKYKKANKCEECHLEFLCKFELIRHAATHSKRRNIANMRSSPFKCADCASMFVYKYHNSVENSAPPANNAALKCPTPNCTSIFKIQSHGRLYPTIHPYIPRRWKCPEINCGKTFLFNSRLKKHQTTHLGTRSFKCPFKNCRSSFKTKQSLRIHIKFKVCSQQFKLPKYSKSESKADILSLQDAQQNYAFISDSRLFQCNQVNCRKQFKTKYDLQRHLFSHSGENPFKCPELNCEYKCKQKSNLKRHLLTFKHAGSL